MVRTKSEINIDGFTSPGLTTGDTRVVDSTEDTVSFGNPSTKVLLESNDYPKLNRDGNSETIPSMEWVKGRKGLGIDPKPNLIQNSSFVLGLSGWTVVSGNWQFTFPDPDVVGYAYMSTTLPANTSYILESTTPFNVATDWVMNIAALLDDFGGSVASPNCRIEVINATNSTVVAAIDATPNLSWHVKTQSFTIPAGTNQIKVRLIIQNTTATPIASVNAYKFAMIKLEMGDHPTPWSNELDFQSVSDGKINLRNAITDSTRRGTVADADGDGMPTFSELVDGVQKLGPYKPGDIVTDSVVTTLVDKSNTPRFDATDGVDTIYNLVVIYNGYYWGFEKTYGASFFTVRKYDMSKNLIISYTSPSSYSVGGFGHISWFQDKGYFVSHFNSTVVKCDLNTMSFSHQSTNTATITDLSFNENVNKVVVTCPDQIYIINADTFFIEKSYTSSSITSTTGLVVVRFRSAALMGSILHISIDDSGSTSWFGLYAINTSNDAKVYEYKHIYTDSSDVYLRYAPTFDALIMSWTEYNLTDRISKINTSTGQIIKDYLNITREYHNLQRGQLFTNKYGLLYSFYDSFHYFIGDKTANDTFSNEEVIYVSANTVATGVLLIGFAPNDIAIMHRDFSTSGSPNYCYTYIRRKNSVYKLL